jgi:hypothetical protein
MKCVAPTALIVFTAAVASAQPTTPSCKAQVAEKKLAGAGQKSFMTKCENDATAACEKSADEKKLAGAAKDSHIKKCVSDSVGS